MTEIFSRVLIPFLTQTTKAVFKTAFAIKLNGRVEWALCLKEVVNQGNRGFGIQFFNALGNIAVVVQT